MSTLRSFPRRKLARRQGAPGARFVVAEHKRRRVRRVYYYEHGPIVRAAHHVGAALAQPSTWLMLFFLAYMVSKW